MDKTVIDNLVVRFSDLGLHLLTALAIWIVGRWLIKFGLGLLVKRLESQKVDHTIAGYARNTVSVALNIGLVVVLMGVLGIETTSFAAFIAGAGLAIGAAWGGLLSNLAAGAFLVVLRPFKAGDEISGGGVTGTVVEVGLFVTILVTQNNVRTYIGNSKLLGATLRNFSANPSRRMELTGTVPRTDDVNAAMAEVRVRLGKITNVLADPAPEVHILSVSEHHYRLAIRPHTAEVHHWPVYFEAIDSLKDLLHSVGPVAQSTDHGEGEEAAEHDGESEREEAEE